MTREQWRTENFYSRTQRGAVRRANLDPLERRVWWTLEYASRRRAVGAPPLGFWGYRAYHGRLRWPVPPDTVIVTSAADRLAAAMTFQVA